MRPAGDAGGALGVALSLAHKHAGVPRLSAEQSGAWRPTARVMPTSRHDVAPFADAMQGALLGPSFDDEEIAHWINQSGCPAVRVAPGSLPARIARLLADGLVVGLVQGRMEFGPRALGARSILGDARSPKM